MMHHRCNYILNSSNYSIQNDLIREEIIFFKQASIKPKISDAVLKVALYSGGLEYKMIKRMFIVRKLYYFR